MIADMHLHYPNHVLRRGPREASECDDQGEDKEGPANTLKRMKRIRSRPFSDRVRALILSIASFFRSDPDWGSNRVDLAELIKGDVGLAFSVLYSPFEEIDFELKFGSPPASDYFQELTHLICVVDEEVESLPDSIIKVVRNQADLDALEPGVIGVVHCVEGGFFLGSTTDEVRANVAELKQLGVAYITLAHLFWRQVAANSNALPMFSDAWYHRLFRQPRPGSEDALAPLGQAAVEAMVEQRILVDVSHMREDVMMRTFRLLDRFDRDLTMPVIASHAGFAFGQQDYLLEPEIVWEIKRRNGVIGLILAQHQLNDGLRKERTTSFAESFDVIRRHIDAIVAITGSYEHIALGTDLDGFIKPTMTGIDYAGDLARLEQAIIGEYGAEKARLIASDNAIRALEQAWNG
jgi:microsomal dipeptidase-like Zn-dependent dipeptidase